jgi:hypothetical protein
VRDRRTLNMISANGAAQQIVRVCEKSGLS